MIRDPKDEAFTICERIADDRSRVTRKDDYATGYRDAATSIAEAIRAKREGRPPTPLERDLRDAEVEARTLARVVAAAEELIGELDWQSDGPDAIRRLLLVFFSVGDLPRDIVACRARARARCVDEHSAAPRI